MDAALTLPTYGTWLREGGSRIWRFLLIKFLGTSAIMVAFFIIYFWLLNHPRMPPTTVPRVFLDHLIPFWPGALPLYLSLWAYVILAPTLLRTPRELVSYSVAAIAMSAVGFAVFYLWPTTVPSPEVDPQLMPTLAHLKIVDATGNAFPSLHVAFALYTALWFRRLFREMGTRPWIRAASWAWCAAIVYSTVAIRQHVVLDAVSGAALGFVVAFVQQRLLDRAPKAPA